MGLTGFNRARREAESAAKQIESAAQKPKLKPKPKQEKQNEEAA